MPKLSRELYQDIIAFLVPHVPTVDERRALLTPVLGDRPVYSRLQWEGSAETFAVHLIGTLSHDELVDLLRAVSVGQDKAAQVQRLIERVRAEKANPPPADQLFIPSAERNKLPRNLVLVALGVIVVGVVGLAGLQTFTTFRLFQPAPLENAPFNVAVAGFTVTGDTTVSVQDARALSESFYRDFETRLEEIQPNLPLTVGVWSPTQIGTVRGDTAEQREANAEALVITLRERRNARVDVLVYGEIRDESGRVSIVPEFYITSSYPELQEVFGRFALNAAIASPGVEQLRTLSSQLTQRSQLLAFIMQGLAQLTVGQFEDAEASFGEALAFQESQSAGGELLYVLIGNTYLGRYNASVTTNFDLVADIQPERVEYLDGAESSFRQALDVNADYARAYVGLGNTLYQQAVIQVSADENWQSIDADRLQTVEQALTDALQAADQPASADIDVKVRFTQGQLALLAYLRGVPGADADAEAAFREVIATYESGNVRVQEQAAQAYGFIGLIHEENRAFTDAADAYTQAAALTQIYERQLLFEYRADYVRYLELELAGDVAQAVEQLERLLQTYELAPFDVAMLRVREGRLYLRDGRPEDALGAYQAAASHDIDAHPTEAARLYAEMGDLYFELGCIEASSGAYERALALEPDAERQDLLRDLIQENETTPDGVACTIDE